MARISDEARRANETAIRHVMEQLLSGGVPPGGKRDIKALATQAGVARTGFYPKKNRDGSPRPGPDRAPQGTGLQAEGTPRCA